MVLAQAGCIAAQRRELSCGGAIQSRSRILVLLMSGKNECVSSRRLRRALIAQDYFNCSILRLPDTGCSWNSKVTRSSAHRRNAISRNAELNQDFSDRLRSQFRCRLTLLRFTRSIGVSDKANFSARVVENRISYRPYKILYTFRTQRRLTIVKEDNGSFIH